MPLSLSGARTFLKRSAKEGKDLGAGEVRGRLGFFWAKSSEVLGEGSTKRRCG